MTSVSDEAISDELLKQISSGRSAAPREIATALTTGDADWRKLLPRIRAIAVGLEKQGRLVFIRKKKVVSSEGLKGVYRFGLPLEE